MGMAPGATVALPRKATLLNGSLINIDIKKHPSENKTEKTRVSV
jgi:hypothetical protein